MTRTLEATKTTAEIVKANFQLELSRLKYQDALTLLVETEVTRENVSEVQQKLKDARRFLTKFDDIKKKGKAEAWAICNWWDDAYNGTKASFESELNIKSQQVAKIASELAEEARVADAEKNRVAAIKQSIDDFFIQQSQAIAAATTPQEIVRIEKLIGSHKGNSSRYQEFLPMLQSKAANLDDLIKDQKVAIKKLEALKTAEKAAEATGDDQAVLDSREAQEELAAKIHENREVVQEKAIGMATQAEVVEPEIIIPIIPKARRSTWKWELIDIKAAQKAGLTKTVIDEDQVNEILKKKRENEEEVTENGVRYFIERRF